MTTETKREMTDKEFYSSLLEMTPDTVKQILTSNEAKQSRTRFYTAQIIGASILDKQEYTNQVKNKHYFLSNFIKDEIICLSAKAGCKKEKIIIHRFALQALTGLGFLCEGNTIEYMLKPIDREFWQFIFKINTQEMKNSQITYYNSKFDLNMPLNPEKEIFSEDEQIDNNFTKNNVLLLINN